MFATFLFALVERLLRCDWRRDYLEHNGPYEDARSARIGWLRLEVNHCFVLDHADAAIGLRLPSRDGYRELVYRVCRGEEQIRDAGFHHTHFRPLLPEQYARRPQSNDIPF